MKFLENNPDWKTIKSSDLIKIIDSCYYKAKKGKYSRFAVEWGQWSREMNLSLKERIGAKNEKEHNYLHLVFNYWVVKSSMLECHFEGAIRNMFKLKRLGIEAQQIKSIITNGEDTPLVEESFFDYVNAVIGEA